MCEREFAEIISALSDLRAPVLPGEYDLHALIADALTTAGIPCRHEYPLGPRRRIDFLCGRIGVEVKKGRPVPSGLKKQITGYLESDELDGLIVVVQRAVILPDVINRKPVRLVSLNMLWGVALP